ncbi:transposase-like zinc-binding domain-containing protein [Clostridium butyricum]
MIERDWKFEKIKKYKENALRENIYNKENVKKYKECPYCGSKSFIKYGNYNRIQRYKCKNEECKKTFSNTMFILYLCYFKIKYLEIYT